MSQQTQQPQPSLSSPRSDAEESWEDIYAKIYQFCMHYAFNNDSLFTEQIEHALRAYFQVLLTEMEEKSLAEINVTIASSHASRILAEDITALKKTDEKRLLFELFFVVFFCMHPNTRDLKRGLEITDQECFLQKYPEFREQISDEIGKLLAFRNCMVMAQHIITAKFNKIRLLDIVTRISEGKDQKYVTGGGQTPATNRRVLIYEREGSITPIRINKDGAMKAHKKNQHDYDRDVKKQLQRDQKLQGKTSRKKVLCLKRWQGLPESALGMCALDLIPASGQHVVISPLTPASPVEPVHLSADSHMLDDALYHAHARPVTIDSLLPSANVGGSDQLHP